MSRENLTPADEGRAAPICVECGNPARNVHYCGFCGKPVCLVCGEGHSHRAHPEAYEGDDD